MQINGMLSRAPTVDILATFAPPIPCSKFPDSSVTTKSRSRPRLLSRGSVLSRTTRPLLERNDGRRFSCNAGARIQSRSRSRDCRGRPRHLQPQLARVYHSELNEAEERVHIRRAVESLRRLTGARPEGWYGRYAPSENTRRL